MFVFMLALSTRYLDSHVIRSHDNVLGQIKSDAETT